jgi:hypothetical protein
MGLCLSTHGSSGGVEPLVGLGHREGVTAMADTVHTGEATLTALLLLGRSR